MNARHSIDDKLRARLARPAPLEGDHLRLADSVLDAALDGSRPLTAGERAALESSPLTQRRLRTLALARRARLGAPWQGSAGMLRAAAGGAELTQLTSDDGCWRLHFTGPASALRVIVQLLPGAPFAASLLRAPQALRVLDGAGAEVLAGVLDADGECEAAWPFALAPDAHFQRHGARFRILPGA